MEDEISDVIYGDLGDFEFNEKLKEQCQKIEDLTEQLNQSVLTITSLQTQMKDLRNDHQKLQKNSSSLLLTARLELGRKKRDISQLQQKIDNRAFRRRNTFTTGVQTDTVDPSFSNYNAENNSENISHQSQHQPVSDLSQFRIPKKNPYARHVHDNHISACDGTENGYQHDEPRRHLPKKNPQARRHDIAQEIHKKQTYEEEDRFKDRRDDHISASIGIDNVREHDDLRRRIPRKNQDERRRDIAPEIHEKRTQEEKCRFKHRRNDHPTLCNEMENEDDHDKARRHWQKKNPNEERYDVETEKLQVHEEKDKFNDRRGEHKKPMQEDKEDFKLRDNRRHNSRGYRDYKKSDSHSNDHKRDGSRSNRKRSCGRSSSDEMDRQPKRRFDSTTNRQRSRSRPARIEEKVTKTKTNSPRRGHWKQGRGNRIDEAKSKRDSISSLKDQDLEAMLIAQTKILNEIDRTDGGEQPVQNEKLSQNQCKGKSSHNGDPSTKPTHKDGNKGLSSANDGSVELNTANDGNVELNIANDGSVELNTANDGSVELNTANDGSVELNTANDGSVELNTANDGNVELNTANDGNVELNTANDGSVEVNTANDGSVELNTANDGSVELNTANDGSVELNTANDTESEDTVEILPADIANDQKTSENSGQELPLMETAETTSNRKLRSSTGKVKVPSESIDEKVAGDDVPKDAAETESVHGKVAGDDRPKNAAESESLHGKFTADDVLEEEVSKSALPESKNDVGGDVLKEVLNSTALIHQKLDVPKDVSESTQLPNDENSNMDIDYELMEHTPVENQTILPCKESDRRMLVENSTKIVSPTVNDGVPCSEANDESFISMNVAVHKGNCLSESTLNSSQERHSLSKSKEYTVEDAGYEIRIFLTKKRKKNKTAKVTS